ncbi:Phytanoyl-CoA dioxygenase [Penicillium expansum]|uniref:Dioxygenase cnsJ n=1 Tax=Penicillium expansum TaxID=27334 RepID=CNSJ_PENEN|nr:Phytanoyl-CoA dioxygenase [Penicillium expansum]A0A0A2JYK3.1 RecName: Full=Dioxygenase cnsJ; AltName: Full=Communesin biosynthesis cluster protein J [Penicillium expansum]KGO40479.1 Phytanoyl-CoA dioxygenase [Penicillium expansum]KGO50071.1 Phytanoyl-CoA dioxygenase [Penicillium expansum]KGO59703.1 Phytanoyl-CoA dioxygenase [Penicillium expansum]
MTVDTAPQSHYQETKVSEIPIVILKSSATDDVAAHEAIEALKVAGVCIVRNLLDRSTVDKVRQELQPYDKQADSFEGFPKNYCQVAGLLSKSPTYAHSIVGNKLFTAVRNYFLTSTYECWAEKGTWMSVKSPPQLDSTLALYVNPGSGDQGLHRDDATQQNWNSGASEYSLGRDSGCAMMVALTECAREDGTTRFIPGSHLWDYQYDHPSNDDPRIRYAEMRPGDAYLMLSSVIHAGSVNYSTDRRRVLAAVFAARSHLRQVENQYLTYDIETVRTFPTWLQRFMGYSLSKLFQGWVDKKDPLLVVDPNAQPEGEDDGGMKPNEGEHVVEAQI